MAEKKYYWLKLKRDFFKRHDIRIIEEMPNGKEYILFYLKLLLESIDHEGALRFSETVPYNEQMLSVITNTNIDIVRSAMKMFIELKMMDILDDKTIYMAEVNKLIGSEAWSTERSRRCREKKKLLQCNTDATSCNEELDIEKEKDKEPYIEVEVVATATATAEEETVENSVDDQLRCIGGTLGKGVVYLTDSQYSILLDKLGLEGFNRYVDRLSSFIIEKQAHVKNHYETILKWYREDTSVNAEERRQAIINAYG